MPLIREPMAIVVMTQVMNITSGVPLIVSVKRLMAYTIATMAASTMILAIRLSTVLLAIITFLRVRVRFRETLVEA